MCLIFILLLRLKLQQVTLAVFIVGMYICCRVLIAVTIFIYSVFMHDVGFTLDLFFLHRPECSPDDNG